MSDDSFCFVFVLSHELFRAGESYLIDVFIYFLGCHANTVVRDGKCFFILIYYYAYARIAQFAFELTYRSECLEFLCSIYGVGNQFA